MFPKILPLIAILFLLALLAHYIFRKRQLRRQDKLKALNAEVTSLVQSSPVMPSHSENVRSLPVTPPPTEMSIYEINPRVDPRQRGSAASDDQSVPPPN